MWRKLTALAVAAMQVVAATCHGFMTEPAARNWQRNSNYCPHCLAAGGPGETYPAGRTWPNSLHGVCGDKYRDTREHEAGGKFATPPQIAAVYKKGQTITIRVKITAPHGGRFSFGICNVDGAGTPQEERAKTTQACFDANQLTNAVDGSKYWWMGKRGNGEYSMQFKLPPTLTCQRCVIQWHWETGNSCELPGTPPGMSMGTSMVPCSQATPEEFWNCADVRVVTGDVPAAEAARQSNVQKQQASVAEPVPPALRAERLRQAAALEAEARTLPAGIREQQMAKAKALRDAAYGKGGEGYDDMYGGGTLDTPFDRASPSSLSPSSSEVSMVMIVAIVGVAGIALPATVAVALTVGVLVWALSAPLRGPRAAEGYADRQPRLGPVHPVAVGADAWLRQRRRHATGGEPRRLGLHLPLPGAGVMR